MLNGWQLIEPHLEKIGDIREVAILVDGAARQIPPEELRSHVEPMQFFEVEKAWEGHPFPKGVENSFWIWTDTHTWYLELNEGYAQVRHIPRNAAAYVASHEENLRRFRSPYDNQPPTV